MEIGKQDQKTAAKIRPHPAGAGRPRRASLQGFISQLERDLYVAVNHYADRHSGMSRHDSGRFFFRAGREQLVFHEEDMFERGVKTDGIFSGSYRMPRKTL